MPEEKDDELRSHKTEREVETARFFAECDTAISRLRANPEAWAQYVKEQEIWERASIKDSFDPDEEWTEDDFTKRVVNGMDEKIAKTKNPLEIEGKCDECGQEGTVCIECGLCVLCESYHNYYPYCVKDFRRRKFETKNRDTI